MSQTKEDIFKQEVVLFLEKLGIKAEKEGVEGVPLDILVGPRYEEEGLSLAEVLPFLTGVPVYSRPDEPIKDINLKPGTEVVFQSLAGSLVSAIVMKETDGTLYAENESSVYNLNWDLDDRHCWTSSFGFNKKALQKVMTK